MAKRGELEGGGSGGPRRKRESVRRPVAAILAFFILIGLVFSITHRDFFRHSRHNSPRSNAYSHTSTSSPSPGGGSQLAGRWRQGNDQPIVVTEEKNGKLIVDMGTGSVKFSPDRNGEYTEDTLDDSPTAPRRTLILAEDKEHLVIQSFQRQGSSVSNATYVKAD